MKINQKTKISEIVKKRPKAIKLLFKAGMSCISCPMAQMETLEQGCKAHGFSEDEINKLVEDLNKL